MTPPTWWELMGLTQEQAKILADISTAMTIAGIPADPRDAAPLFFEDAATLTERIRRLQEEIEAQTE